MKDSKIEWTDHTFNPWIGCTRVSPGCQHCYAEVMMAERYKKVKWGPQGKRVRTSAAYWRQPHQWNRKAQDLAERHRVFVGSLADVFEDKPDQREEMDRWRDHLFHFPHLYNNLDWLFLTKRPENVMRMVHPFWHEHGFPPNVWIGTSVEDQQYADQRIPELLKIPAAVRFLSVEPMLGPIDLHFDFIERAEDGHPLYWHSQDCPDYCDYACASPWIGGINWVIVGGESGHGARPMHPGWARSIRDQCLEAGVPFFLKQWGEWIAKTQVADLFDDLFDGKWVTRPNWEAVIRSAREWGALNHSGEYFPETTTWNGRQEDPRDDYEVTIYQIGKHRAGRLLDGYEWSQFPATGK